MPDFEYMDATVIEDTKEREPLKVNSTKPGSLAKSNNAGQFSTGQFKQASSAMVPKEMRDRLSVISQTYGLPFDIGDMSIKIATPENLNAFRNIVDMISRQSKLLPEILNLVKRLMKADLRLADYHKEVTKAAIKHKEGIDLATADIFASMAKHAVNSSKLEVKVNRRQKLKDARFQAWQNVYEGTSFSNEMAVIDAEAEQRAANSRLRTEARLNRVAQNTTRDEADAAFDVESHGGGKQVKKKRNTSAPK